MCVATTLKGTSGYAFVGRGGTADINYIVGNINTNGSFDTTFFTTGVRTGSIDDTDNLFRGVLRSELNGRQFVAGGYSWINGNWTYTLAAFLTNGLLDTTFNTIGYRHTALSANESGALAIDTQTDGGAPLYRHFPVAAGPVKNSDWDFGLARYTTDGLLDTGFSTDGMISRYSFLI